ncbi:hypothetical protein GUITHDRAFT_148236 [Guillardia theta CCMP2712]|uniref:Uncharacterized protein n=1 Tax=Guillardia theta (strain CCMP2712) TaxID=905079 RepID=L1IA62_GUITC|nr:hypothetical protein GUITHDRAFT_148236 [Guillardia theta CCMP2712]EKX32992.1 hypothetical protein GUITHDRAFT_148236 [Guillardia theta CCMP2712]|eukprot:XP_005819972.1 hypothetical protein GUITHDRAFT_148236 [Guillardia theta CCMP2712]
MKVSRLKHLLKHRIPNPQLSDKRQLEEDEARGSASSQESPTYTSQRFLGDDLYSHHDAMEVVEQHGQDVGDVKLNKPTKKKLLTKLRIPQLKEHSNKLQDSDAVASFLHTDRPSQPELYREARYRRLVVRTRSDSLSSDVEELEKKEKFEAVRARREAEKQLVILRDKLSKEQSKNKVWSLEECLSTKDADLEMQISSLRANDTIKKLNKEDVKHLDFKTFLRIIRKLQLGGSSAPRVSFQEPDDQEAPAQDDGVWDEFV